MGKVTEIGWTGTPIGRVIIWDGEPTNIVPGATFNPWEGCEKIAPECKLCYAEARNKRLTKVGTPGPNSPGKPFKSYMTALQTAASRLSQTYARLRLSLPGQNPAENPEYRKELQKWFMALQTDKNKTKHEKVHFCN